MYDDKRALEVTIIDGPGTSSSNPLYVTGGTGGSGSSSSATATGTYQSSPPTLANGQTTPILVDSKGNQLVNLNAGFGTAISTPMFVELVTSVDTAPLPVAPTSTYLSTAPTLSNNATTPVLVDSKGNALCSIAGGFGSASGNPLYTFLTNSVGVSSIANQHVDGSGNLETSVRDSLTGAAVTVAQFHVADNTSPGGTGNGLLTGGVTQLLNALGNLDRQRATSSDNAPAVGIATGAQQLASPIAVTSSSALASGAASGSSITLSAVSGLNRGAPWTIRVNSMLILELNTVRQESALVTAVSGNTVTLTFGGTNGASLYAHSAGFAVNAFTFNQARDASTPDGATGAGFAAGATYLFNGTLNGYAGGWESERSANGELDGATGAGAAIAVGYEFNAGGPGGGNYDRERNVQGKGRVTAVVSSGGTQGSTSVTLAAAPTTLQPGMPVLFATGTTIEVAYTSSTYVAGTNPVLLASPLANNVTYTAAYYDTYAPNGPGLAAITPFGIGIEEDVVWDPVSQAFYLERAATQDEVSGQNLPMDSLGIYNPATGLFDRATGSSLRGLDVSIRKNTMILTTTPLAANGVFTSAWIDTLVDNSTTINLTNLANVAGSFVVQETNDPANTSMLAQLFPYTSSFSSAGSVNYRNTFQVTGRYWRVIYTNQGTAQTSFELAYSASGIAPVSNATNPQPFVITNGYNNGGVQAGTPASDGLGSGSTALYVQNFPMAWNGAAFDRQRKDSYAAGPLWMTSGGSTPAYLTASGVIKATAGRLCRVQVTSALSGNVTIYDSPSAATGNIIAVIASTQAVGGPPLLFDWPFTTGAYASFASAGGTLAVSFY